MSQMEPFAAAQATSAMSEEMATAVQAALPPERAAAIIASGGQGLTLVQFSAQPEPFLTQIQTLDTA